MDWIHSRPPWLIDREIEVWSPYYGLRSAAVLPSLDTTSLWFTDCNHALQNAYCDRNRIEAWRYKEKATT